MKVAIVEGPDQGGEFAFDRGAEVVIGREAGCGIRIRDPESSRQHARLVAREGRLFVEDLHSRNGTFVNDRRVTHAPVCDGDRVRIGATVLALSETGAPAPAEPAGGTPQGGSSTVMLALHHREADLLAGRTMAVSVADMARENEVLREICRLSQIVGTEKDSSTVLSAALERIHEALSADTACLLTRCPSTGGWRVEAASPQTGGQGAVRFSRTVVDETVRQGAAILAADPADDDRFAPSRSIADGRISSVLCSPLRVGETFGGVLFVDRRCRREIFTQMDLRLAASAGNILGLFLEKAQYESELRNRQRLAVIGEVIAGLAHCVKNIVAGLRLSVQGMEAALKRGNMEYVATFMKSVAAQEGRISDLMLNMLTYAKDREPVRAPVAVAPLLLGLAEPFAPQMAEQGIRFAVEADPRVPAVHGEELALQRLFLNLFMNARDAVQQKTGDGKSICARVTPADDGRAVEVRFRDTGCGIPRDRLPGIFAAFLSTKGSAGTGLGLPVVRKIVDEHGGSISVDSVEGQWTEFRVTLPAAPAGATGAVDSGIR